MKTWQKIDFYGRILVLFAAFLQIFFVVPLSNFDLSVFWYNTMDNQYELALMISDDDMTYDEETRAILKLGKNLTSANEYGEFHQAIKKYSNYGFALLFFVGSFCPIFRRNRSFVASCTFSSCCSLLLSLAPSAACLFFFIVQKTS